MINESKTKFLTFSVFWTLILHCRLSWVAFTFHLLSPPCTVFLGRNFGCMHILSREPKIAIFGRYGVFFNDWTICETWECVREQYIILVLGLDIMNRSSLSSLALYRCHANAAHNIAALFLNIVIIQSRRNIHHNQICQQNFIDYNTSIASRFI